MRRTGTPPAQHQLHRSDSIEWMVSIVVAHQKTRRQERAQPGTHLAGGCVWRDTGQYRVCRVCASNVHARGAWDACHAQRTGAQLRNPRVVDRGRLVPVCLVVSLLILMKFARLYDPLLRRRVAKRRRRLDREDFLPDDHRRKPRYDCDHHAVDAGVGCLAFSEILSNGLCTFFVSSWCVDRRACRKFCQVWHAGTLARWHAGTLARWHPDTLTPDTC
jgi:hypothetical protein